MSDQFYLFTPQKLLRNGDDTIGRGTDFSGRESRLTKVVHTCPYCKQEFDLDTLMYSPEVALIGMSFADDDPDWVYYFFQHEISNCGSSFVVKVREFERQIDEPISSEVKFGGDCCEEHCVSLGDLGACNQECSFAPYRRFLHKMLELKKKSAERVQGS